MTLIEAIRTFFRGRKTPVHVQDLYAHLPDEHQHSLRARIYERLGTEFKRVGRGLYVACDAASDVTCVVACDDAWKAIRDVPSGTVDAVITDPPYLPAGVAFLVAVGVLLQPEAERHYYAEVKEENDVAAANDRKERGA